ncbi:nucleoid-associated protein [Salinarimonas chemoclinalis]|uniref:nucleoid-associated protein n=1 Tax=Salinarimonas chemoclinalis TaxID=3241599 RepID=UPI003558A7FE
MTAARHKLKLLKWQTLCGLGQLMSFFTQEQMGSLSIERMVFHVVGPHLTAPILLEELNPPVHTNFFLERVKSAVESSRFLFQDHSDFLEQMRIIENDDSQFSAVSRTLAGRFQSQHEKKSTKDGVFLLFQLFDGAEYTFAVIKYDHDQVIGYEIEDDEGKKRAILRELRDTFVKKKEAMQKTALIRLSENAGVVHARDRGKKDGGIADYFRDFLGVRREYTESELTKRLDAAARETYAKHRESLPNDVKKDFGRRVYNHLAGGGSFNDEDLPAFLNDVFSAAAVSDELVETFKGALKRNKIDGETFQFDTREVPEPTHRKIVTREGIKITYDRRYEDRVTEIERDGEIIFEIRTAGLAYDDRVAEKDSGR